MTLNLQHMRCIRRSRRLKRSICWLCRERSTESKERNFIARNADIAGSPEILHGYLSTVRTARIPDGGYPRRPERNAEAVRKRLSMRKSENRHEQILRLAREIGKLTAEKNVAYGSSFELCGEHLKLLYPEGIRPEQYTDMLLMARIFDKEMRIAHQKDAFGESPYRDLAGYALCGAAKDEYDEDSE